MSKIFVIDTNVLIYNPSVIATFNDAILYIPLPVLEELDAFKLEKNETGRNSRLACKILEHVSSLGNLQEGVTLNNGNAAFLGKLPENFSVVVRAISCQAVLKNSPDFTCDQVDNRLLALCKQLSEEHGSAILVTKDFNLRVKARSIGIMTMEFDESPVETETYLGWQEEWVETYELKALTVSTLTEKFNLADFKLNQFLLVRSTSNPDKFRLFRCVEEGLFNEVVESPKIWGFKPRNAFQSMALDLLLDDSVPLVFLMGAAGTGKTLLTLLAGLYKVIVDRQYDKLFVARPLVSLGADIGFIPGDLQEKLFHWMHPFYDNMEYIVNQLHARGEEFDIPRNYNFGLQVGNKKANRQKERQNFYRKEYSDNSIFTESKVQEVVTTLQQRGFLSLEAITHMRGRSLPNQFIFIDEAQNLSPAEMKTIITRAGENTKIILAGDPYQIDSQHLDFYNNGLSMTSQKLRNEKLVGQIFMDFSERSDLARLAIKKL